MESPIILRLFTAKCSTWNKWIYCEIYFIQTNFLMMKEISASKQGYKFTKQRVLFNNKNQVHKLLNLKYLIIEIK